MQTTMPSLNGHAPHGAPTVATRKTGKRKVRVRAEKPTTPRPAKTTTYLDLFRISMTIGLGVGIPLLSLAMSKLAGTLAAAGMYLLALFAFGLMVAVLSVSLSHLSWAVSDVTGSGPWASWALAVALDLSLVLCELCHVYASGLGIGLVTTLVMLTVAAFSMALNVHAFARHRP